MPEEEKHSGCEGTATMIDTFTCKYKGKQYTLRARDITEEEDAEISALRERLNQAFSPEDKTWEAIPLAERNKLMYLRAIFMLGGRERLVPGPYGEGWSFTKALFNEEPADEPLLVSTETFLRFPLSLRSAIANELTLFYYPTFSGAELKNSQGR